MSVKKSLCDSCEHRKNSGTRITKLSDRTFFKPNLICTFKNLSLNNSVPYNSCDSYSVSINASPEEKFNALAVI